MRRLLPILLLLLAFPACAAGYSARVIGIADGDTITVLTADKTQHRIRLWGIDAPETGQDFGSRAKQAASELAFGKQVTIRPRDTDRYGRTVAEVILPDGRSMNREMVGKGMAWWFRRYAPRDADLARLEGEARAARIGLWSQPNPVPPWEWRRGEGGAADGRSGRQPAQPCLPQAGLPRSGDDGREEPGDLRQRGGGGEGRVSAVEGLLVKGPTPALACLQRRAAGL